MTVSILPAIALPSFFKAILLSVGLGSALASQWIPKKRHWKAEAVPPSKDFCSSHTAIPHSLNLTSKNSDNLYPKSETQPRLPVIKSTTVNGSCPSAGVGIPSISISSNVLVQPMPLCAALVKNKVIKSNLVTVNPETMISNFWKFKQVARAPGLSGLSTSWFCSCPTRALSTGPNTPSWALDFEKRHLGRIWLVHSQPQWEGLKTWTHSSAVEVPCIVWVKKRQTKSSQEPFWVTLRLSPPCWPSLKRMEHSLQSKTLQDCKEN